MLISDGRRRRPTFKKNRRLVLAGALKEGEPRNEILLDLPSFSLAAICKRRIFIARKEVYIFVWIYLSLDTETSSVFYPTALKGYLVGTLVRGCRCATSWSDLDLTFDLAVVALSLKILSGLYLENRKV